MSCDSCNDRETIEVCFTPADGVTAPVTLLKHIKYGVDALGDPANSSYISTADDTLTAVDPASYLGGGTITSGACVIPQPDIEWTKLCEKLTDGTSKKFIRRAVTTFDAFATPTTITADFELDKITPYTVSDEAQVGECGCDPLANTGLVTDIADWK